MPPVPVLTNPEHSNTIVEASPFIKREGGSILKPERAHPPILRRFALFMDGIARGALLPFGPKLVYRIVYGIGETLPSLWSNVAFFLSMLVSTYILGRWMGQGLALWFSFGDECKLRVYVARLGGTLLSLQFFTYFVGLSSIRTLLLARFFSALFAGMLSGMTQSIELPEDVQFLFESTTHSADSLDEEAAKAARKRDAYIDTASGTVKIYLAGLSVSILSGGLLYDNVFTNLTFQAWTSAYLYNWFLLLLLLVGVASEIVLRRVFASFSKQRQNDLKQTLRSKDKSVASPSTPLSPRKSLKILEDPLVFASPFRSRTESYSTVEEAFFDCQSVFSDQPEELRSPPLSPVPTVVSPTAEETQIAQYVQGKCVYPDGSAAYVPQGDCVATVPENYLKFYSNNQSKAQKAWADTQDWRLEKRVWKIHTIPNRWFSRIKDAYPHFAHGCSKHGYPIIYEQPGKMNLKELFRDGCQISDMVHHYTFFMEFVSNRICASEEVRSRMGSNAPPHSSSSWGIMLVMDIENAGLGLLSTDVVRYLREAGDINSKHYPMSMKRAFVINVPFWFAGAWGSIKGILPESVHVDILSKSKYLDVLREYVEDDQIPPEYGGTSSYRLGEHPFEIELRRLVDEAQGGEEVENGDITHDASRKQPTLATVPRLLVEEDIEQGTFVTAEPLEQPSHTKPIRRKGVDGKRMRQHGHASTNGEDYNGGKSSAGQSDIFMVVNLIYCIWSIVQGAIEVAIPLWILTPASNGGLGYSPFRSGISTFCSCLTLLCAFQKNLLCYFVSRIPSENPLRGLRVGVGSEFFLFALLCALTTYSDVSTREQSFAVVFCATVLIACIGLSTILGGLATRILHRIAAEWYAKQTNRQNSFLTKYCSEDRFVSDCETGRFTTGVNITCEVFGSLLFAAMWSWSILNGRQSPFDGTCIFFASSLASCLLYVCSFSLHLNPAGEFAPHPKEKRNASGIRRCISLLGEMIVVALGDVLSLFEEAKCKNMVSRGRRVSYSLLDDEEGMERGEISRHSGKAV